MTLHDRDGFPDPDPLRPEDKYGCPWCVAYEPQRTSLRFKLDAARRRRDLMFGLIALLAGLLVIAALLPREVQ